MNKKAPVILVSVMLLAGAGPLFAQHAEELYSPLFLGSGPQTSSLESPLATIFNPAAAGLEQRTRLELNYIALPGFDAEKGWGHSINAGLSLPTNFGVVSFAGNFLSSPYTSVNLGTMGGLHVSLSKDLYGNFLIGVGVQTILGTQSGTNDWGLGADLGVIHNVGKLGFLEDFTWGLAIRGLGKGYEPTTDTDYLPRAFTPAVGVSFKPVKTNSFSWGFSFDASFPGFNGILLYGATEVDLFDFTVIRASFHIDPRELQAGTVDRFPVSFGLSLKFNLDVREKVDFLGISEKGWNKSDLKIDAAYAPLQNGIFAAGLGVNLAIGSIDKTPPDVDLEPVRPAPQAGVEPDPNAPVYISPNLDGVQDDLVLKTAITDERFVKGYKLIIEDKTGNPVRVIENKEDRPENVDLDNVLNRLVYVKSGIKVPPSLRWDGKNETGGLVEDGEYTYHLEAWDDNGNKTVTPKKSVVMDTQAPAAEAKPRYLVFSPNGDGNKDVLPLDLSGSTEDAWKGVITDAAGKEVKTFTWTSQAPAAIAWDGKNNEDALVNDGVYTFTLSSVDRAGNAAAQKVDNIIVSTVATPITMKIDTASFSPNGDGVKETVEISLAVPVTSGIESWNLSIMNNRNEAVRVFSGKEKIQTRFTFDGQSDAGKQLPEGVYKASLDVLYINGNNPKVESPEIVLDVTPPSIKLAFDNPVFSPNNDGNKDVVTINTETSEEDEWLGEISSAKTGITVKTFRWKSKPDRRIVWGGLGDAGTLLPDGVYNLVLSSTDRAGNRTRSTLQPLTINTEETPVLFTAALTHFSPNGDKVNDTINLMPQLRVTTDIESYTMRIKDKAGKTVKTITGAKQAPLPLQWDGKTNAGAPAPDGTYSAALEVLYVNGNNPAAKTQNFELDVKAPEITLSTDYTLFSPDGDGLKDKLVINQQSSSENLWEGRVTDRNGRVVRSFFWKGKAGNASWDGKDDNGNMVLDGSYVYAVSATDEAGNMTRREITGIEIDTAPTPVFVTVDGSAFSPNGDKIRDAIGFTVYAENKKGIKAWSLELSQDKKGAQRVLKGTQDLPEKIVWDGTADNKQPAPEGTYAGLLTVEYSKGNKPAEKTTPFILDVTAPNVDLKANPLPFSPDNDGVEDELLINLKVQDATPIAAWSLQIKEPTGTNFIDFQGKGTPAERIIWNGLSEKGELVQAATDYKLQIRVTDDVGNSTSLEKIIPVDVLVIRDGDRLYIRVPSITFKPDTANYMDVSKEALAKNLWALDRLAQIFKKYRTYNILIEGHAVSVFWRDPARSKREQVEELLPLSKSRAEAIKRALVEKGIEANRISTDGVGASRPVFPFSDEANLWKNRRVEFILLKK